MSNENDIELAFQHLDHINDLNVKRIQQESQHLPNDGEVIANGVVITSLVSLIKHVDAVEININ